MRHGISQALTHYEPELRAVLKKGGFLTRDSRVVERKKYGKAKARRSFQFSQALSYGPDRIQRAGISRPFCFMQRRMIQLRRR